MPRMLKAFQDVRQILEFRSDALHEFIYRKRITSGQLFIQNHLLVLITFPVGILLGPFTWLSGWKTMKIVILFTLVLLTGIFLIACLFDKVCENSGYKELETRENPPKRNIALFVHLPLASVGIFYFLHPWIGVLLLFFASIYCLIISIESISEVREISRLQSLTYFINSVIFLVIPILLLAFIVAISKTFYYIYIQ